mgnify:FL=1
MTVTRFASFIAVGLLAASYAIASDSRPDLSGTWKIDPARTDEPSLNKDLMLQIEDRGDNIHVKETRGTNAKSDISEFTCSTAGSECGMHDAGSKAKVTVYYNEPALVVLKTHGRRGSMVEKRRISLSPKGDSLLVEVVPIEPSGKS